MNIEEHTKWYNKQPDYIFSLMKRLKGKLGDGVVIIPGKEKDRVMLCRGIKWCEITYDSIKDYGEKVDGSIVRMIGK